MRPAFLRDCKAVGSKKLPHGIAPCGSQSAERSDQAQCFLVAHQREVRMHLQDACGHLRSDGTEECLLDDLGLACAVCHHEHLACLHDSLDAHGISLLGHQIHIAVKEALVCLNGLGGQVHTVGLQLKGFARLVEADVAVVADAQQLQVDTAGQDTYLFHGDASHIDGQFYVSIDYGTHNPCSMGLWVIHDGKALRIKESYFDSRAERVQRTDEEHYAELERLTKGYYIQAVVVDPSAASFIETIRRHGKYLVIPADNDVLNGIRCVASLMQAGLVTIHESCAASRREFGLYSWDDKAKEDRVVKENDHAMDDIRYFCYTILAPLIRWADWRRK